MSKEKPEKIPLLKFITEPIGKMLRDLQSKIIINIFHYWECDYCKKLHSLRVKRYSNLLGYQYRDFCSLGKKASNQLNMQDFNKAVKELSEAVSNRFKIK